VKRYVVDASFMIEALTEPDSLASGELACILEEVQAGKLEILAPNILGYEMANFFSREQLSKEQGSRLAEQFNSLPILSVQFSVGDLLRTVWLARELYASAYNATFHLLALENDATFLTLDKKYFSKAKIKGAIRLVAA